MQKARQKVKAKRNYGHKKHFPLLTEHGKQSSGYNDRQQSTLTSLEDESMKINYPLTVFFDGACGVCSTEMSYYRSIADQRVKFVDIAAVDFEAESFDKTIGDFQKELHARDADGRYFTGVEAFRRLWEALPSPFYPLLSTVTGLPGIHISARAGYAVFARFRHLLPSKHVSSCPVPKDPRGSKATTQ